MDAENSIPLRMIDDHLGRRIPEGDISDLREFTDSDLREMRFLYEINKVLCVYYVRYRMGAKGGLVVAKAFVDEVIGDGVKIVDFDMDYLKKFIN